MNTVPNPSTDTPEQTRLADRFRQMLVVDTHTAWGPAAAAMTPEQRAAELNRIFDQEEADAADVVTIRVSALRDIHASLKQLVRLGQSSAEEFLRASPELRELRSKIFGLSDFPAVMAGQALPKDIRKQVRDNLAGEG